jgi:hypothetical protein
MYSARMNTKNMNNSSAPNDRPKFPFPLPSVVTPLINAPTANPTKIINSRTIRAPFAISPSTILNYCQFHFYISVYVVYTTTAPLKFQKHKYRHIVKTNLLPNAPSVTAFGAYPII